MRSPASAGAGSAAGAALAAGTAFAEIDADALTTAVGSDALDEAASRLEGASPGGFSEPRSASLAQAVASAPIASQNRKRGLKLLMFALAGPSMARQPNEPKLPANANSG